MLALLTRCMLRTGAFIIYVGAWVRGRLECFFGVRLGRDLIFSTWGASFGPGENYYLPCDLNYPHTETKFTKHPIQNNQAQTTKIHNSHPNRRD